jgi:hypothetical protein
LDYTTSIKSARFGGRRFTPSQVLVAYSRRSGTLPLECTRAGADASTCWAFVDGAEFPNSPSCPPRVKPPSALEG